MPLRWSKPQRVCRSDCPKADTGKVFLNVTKKKALIFSASDNRHLPGFLASAGAAASFSDFGNSIAHDADAIEKR